MAKVVHIAFALIAMSVLAAQQPANPVLPKQFDVVSVKRVERPNGEYSVTDRADPGMIDYPLTNLVTLIMQAYDVKDYQIAGPDWLNHESYSVKAKHPPNATRGEIALMFQNMLADRFRLTLHRETRELPMYALVVDKNGLKVRPTEPGDQKPPAGRAASN